MRFGSSQWLWGLLLIPLLLGYLIWAARQRARLAARFAEPGLWRQLAGEAKLAAIRWKPILFIIAVALVIVGLAGPQWGARAVMLQRRGLDIVVALDVSRSMLAADVKPNRLERAKREISAVLDRLKGDRIGLVVFSGDAFVQCPLTLDAAAARMLLDATGINSGGRPGTAVSEAIEAAIGMYDEGEKQFKVLILVTDGEGTEGDALAAAQSAAEQGIRIYSVGVGTPQGEPIPDYDERGNQIGFKKDEGGQVVLSKLDEVTLQKVALATEGRYFRAGPSHMELDALFDELSTLEKKEMEGRLFTEFEQRFHYFLLPAFLLLALEMAIPRRTRNNTKNTLLGLFVLFVLFPNSASADQFAKRNNTGNKLLEDGKIDSAITEYYAARVERPGEPGVVYNLGSAYHQKGAFDTAATQLQNALAHVDPTLKPSAYYNLGNTLYRLQEYESAIEAYKQALLANPSDMDAKHNLELTLRKMNEGKDSTSQDQEQKEKQENQQDSTGEQNQNQEQEQNQDSTQNDQQQQQQNQDGDREQEQQQQDQNQDGQPREQKQPKPVQGMTQADAERLLDALKQNELALQKKRAQRVSGEKVAKDW